MKGRAIDQLVFETMFRCPKAGDPTNFHHFLQMHLVNEVRAETIHFYGNLKSLEAQYPGLDYSYKPHRARLGRYPWHDLLFRTMDLLGLTKHEIKELTKWEGTLWAKERYEKEHNIIIRDTTGDVAGEWIPPHLRQPRSAPKSEGMDYVGGATVGTVEIGGSETSDDMEDDEEDSETDLDSVGVESNARLLSGHTGRRTGSHEVLDEEFEEWLKSAVESGREGRGSGSNPSNRSSPPLPPRYLQAARLGQLPEDVRDLLRVGWLANTESRSQSRSTPNRAYSPSGQRRLRQTMRSEIHTPSTSTSRYAAQDRAALENVDRARLARLVRLHGPNASLDGP